MREILYRGLRAEGKGFVYGSLLSVYDGTFDICYFGDKLVCEETNAKELTLTYKSVRSESVGEYIGRKDDNDTKIFEGDEVIIEGGENHQGCREYLVKGVITYSVSGFYIVTKEGVHYSFADTPFDSIEIVGNIHE